MLFLLWQTLSAVRSEIISAEIQEKLKLAVLFPHLQWYWIVITCLTLTLVFVLRGSWKKHRELLLAIETEKKRTHPDITIEVKEVIRTLHSSLFVHLTIFNSSEAPTLIQDYRAVCTLEDKTLEGEATDDVSTFEVVKREEDINVDGISDWRDIWGQLLTDVKSQISPSSQLKRGTHFSGWIRFYFGYSLDWPLEAPLSFSIILKDSYNREYSFDLECPPYNFQRVIQRNKRSIKLPA